LAPVNIFSLFFIFLQKRGKTKETFFGSQVSFYFFGEITYFGGEAQVKIGLVTENVVILSRKKNSKMKKILFSLSLFISAAVTAQDNWDSLIVAGVGSDSANFSIIQKFNGKMYVGGVTNPANTLNLYSSSSGDMGTYNLETGFNSVATPVGVGAGLSASTANNSYMFLGSAANINCSITIPQVYKFDGATYSLHGPSAADYSSLPPNNAISPGSQIDAIAIYNPSGNSANDSVYAFVNGGNGNNISVWKAKANTASPVWVNSTNFSAATGITKAYDAITWHKRLYVCVNRVDSLDASLNPIKVSLVLSTADGVTWDTVANTNKLSYQVGMTPGNFMNYHFAALEIHNDTLILGFSDSNGPSLWATVDSLNAAPHWNCLYNNNDQAFYDLVDLQSDGYNLWIETNSSNGYVSVYRYNYTLGMYGFLPSSSNSTDLNSFYNCNSYRLQYFNNYIYTSGYLAADNSINTINYIHGNTWRLGIPKASFVNNPVKACLYTSDTLKNTSIRYLTTQWFVDGALYSKSNDTTIAFASAGSHTVMVVSYNGNIGAIADSIKQIVTVYNLPSVDSAKAVLTSICQGQDDTVKAYVSGGAAPYIYMWSNSLNIIGAHDSIVPFTLTTVSTPSPALIGFQALDGNGCLSNYTNVFVSVHPGDSLSGLVLDTINPVTAGKVYLFEKKINHVGVADSAGTFDLSTTGNGKFYFPTLYYGNYYVKVIADTSNPLYNSSVGTYYSAATMPYGHAFQWDSSLVIQQYSCSGSNDTINRIKIIKIPAVASGPGTITGNVSESNSFGQRSSTPNSFFGAPLKGVDIKLGKNPGGNAAARTTTDNNGNYSFHNVPLGQYKIYVDIPNYGMDSVRAVDLNVNNVSPHNDYFVDSAMVRVVPIDTVANAICAGDSIMLGGFYQHTAGYYTDIVQSLQGYDSVVVTNLAVTALPTLSVTTSSDSVCIGNSVTLTAVGNSTSYLWSSNAGSATTSTVSVSPAVNTTYTVTGTASSCSRVQTISIVAKNCIGIQNINQKGFAVYPNPAIDKLFIETQKSATIKLIDILGQTVLEQTIPMGSSEINLSQLPQGAYELIINAGGQITAQKLVLNK
jgi:hypothetical protein